MTHRPGASAQNINISSRNHERISIFKIRANIGSHFQSCHKNIDKNIKCLKYRFLKKTKERTGLFGSKKSGPPFLKFLFNIDINIGNIFGHKNIDIFSERKTKMSVKMSGSGLKKKECSAGLMTHCATIMLAVLSIEDACSRISIFQFSITAFTVDAFVL